MRLNEYNSIEEFINEYNEIYTDNCNKYIGIDFEYDNNKYRMCREPIGKYFIYKVKDLGKQKMPIFITLGSFDTIELLLNATVIDNKLFSVIIMDDNTIILGKD